METFEYHSEEVQDIIGKMPSWIISKGMMVIAIIIILTIGGAWFIKYPDVISAPVLISASVPPVKIIAQAEGRISSINVNDGQIVEKNQLIATIDNAANIDDIFYLKGIVELLDTTLNIETAIKNISINKRLQVGEIQPEYASLFQAISNYHFFSSNRYYSTKIGRIKKQKETGGQIEKIIDKRDSLLKEQVALEKWKDSINQVLLKDKVISNAEYNEIKKTFLSQKMVFNDNSNSKLQNEQLEREYEKSISDIKNQFQKDKIDVLESIRNNSKRIKGQIATWERQNLLRAPIEGKVIFFKIWKANQYVNYGEPIFVVLPSSQEYYFKAQLPLYKAGKVKPGQRALIKLNEYPYEEFGMLRAVVNKITAVALDSNYNVQFTIEDDFNTTRNKKIEIKPETTGVADIVTNDRNILQRIFDGVFGKIYK